MSFLLAQWEILWPALCAGLLVLAIHVPLGQEVLRRGIIFLDLAIAQTAAFGVVLANTFFGGEHLPVGEGMTLLIAIAAASIGSALLYSIRNVELRIQESMIGILFVLMATGIILVLSSDPHGGERLKEVLVGQILWLQPSDLWQLLAVYVFLGCLWWLRSCQQQDWLFYPIFAVAITLSTKYVGVYLVFASLIIPAIVTLHSAHSVLRAYVLGALGYSTGLIASAFLDLPAGASVVWSLAFIAGTYALLSRRHKK